MERSTAMPPLVYETHCHTPLCRHADGEPIAYAAMAIRRGLRGITFTCHNPMPESYGNPGRMLESEVPQYRELIQRAADGFRGKLDVRVGLECDYFPNYVDHVRRQIDTMQLSYVIGSVHPFLGIWRRRFVIDGDPMQTQANYFDQLAEAAETRLFDTISHPDLIKNMLVAKWDIHHVAINLAIRSCLDRIAATGTAMELNTSGVLKTVPEMNPNPLMLAMMREREIPVVVGADAHVPERVSADFERAYDLLEAAGYMKVSHFIDRKRHEIAIAEARASLVRDATAV